jgi:uncharacterized integral membrane protein
MNIKSTKTWIYILLAIIVLNSATGVLLAYLPSVIKDPLTISSHNIVNIILGLVVMYLFKTCTSANTLNVLVPSI